MPAKPQVPIENRLEQSLRAYWLERGRGHLQDLHVGVPMSCHQGFVQRVR